MPAFSPDVASDQWPLTEQGRTAAAALAIPAGAYLVASAEVKAVQTLAPHGPVHPDPRFNEVHRANEPWDGPYRVLRKSYVDGTDHPGWEPRADVAVRFWAGISDHAVRAAGRPLCIATHGMALTVWLSAAIGLDDPSSFWDALEFPALIPVEPPPP
jgi:broad specificity phosphatase PhoE